MGGQKNDKEPWKSTFHSFFLKLKLAFTREYNWNKDCVLTDFKKTVIICF